MSNTHTWPYKFTWMEFHYLSQVKLTLVKYKEELWSAKIRDHSSYSLVADHLNHQICKSICYLSLMKSNI